MAYGPSPYGYLRRKESMREVTGVSASSLKAGRNGGESTSRPSSSYHRQETRGAKFNSSLGRAANIYRTLNGTAPASKPPSRREVCIHVFDEVKDIKKDFYCEFELLLSSMRYFKSYLNKAELTHQIEITVHCEINVFSWLMRYIKSKLVEGSTEVAPVLSVVNCLSILISSQFLRIDELVEECIDYIAKRFVQISRSVDLSTLDDSTLARLTDIVDVEILEVIRSEANGHEKGADEEEEGDVTDTDILQSFKSDNELPETRPLLVSRMYKHRVVSLVSSWDKEESADDDDVDDNGIPASFAEAQDNRHQHPEQRTPRLKGEWGLSMCSTCDSVFSIAHRDDLRCPNASVLVDYHGNIFARHQALRGWSIRKSIILLRKQSYSWRWIYWNIWSFMNHLRCSTCGEFFPVAYMYRCRYHVEQPIFREGHNLGEYPCCGQVVSKFNTGNLMTEQKGCHLREHRVEVANEREEEILRTAHALRDIVFATDADADEGWERGEEPGEGAEEEDWLILENESESEIGIDEDIDEDSRDSNFGSPVSGMSDTAAAHQTFFAWKSREEEGNTLKQLGELNSLRGKISRPMSKEERIERLESLREEDAKTFAALQERLQRTRRPRVQPTVAEAKGKRPVKKVVNSRKPTQKPKAVHFK